jgi:hypothetical protein
MVAHLETPERGGNENCLKVHDLVSPSTHSSHMLQTTKIANDAPWLLAEFQFFQR